MLSKCHHCRPVSKLPEELQRQCAFYEESTWQYTQHWTDDPFFSDIRFECFLNTPNLIFVPWYTNSLALFLGFIHDKLLQ